MASIKPLNKTILIVEDEPSMLRALREKFQREGFDVMEATDGEQALRRALESKPDIILLDIVMPKMDGLTMLKELRRDKKYGERVPVIMLTNLSADNDKVLQDVVETQPSFYLVKTNWTVQEIVKKVKERLG